jgi:hypothetical protein
MSFDTLKKTSASAISKLVDAAEKLNAPKGNYGNEDYWTPTVDKAGNGYAVIRFLPAKEGEDLPWVRFWDHGFKGPNGQWYIENSLTSIDLPDPVSEANSVLWNSGIESDKDTVRLRKRRLHYVSNIEVISDSGNPANDGKICRYKYGKKIFDKINDVMQPQFKDETPVNPFDFWTGANFKLKIRQVEGYRNYDKSEFDKPSEYRNGDEAQLKEVYDNLPSLQEIVDPKNFKPYAELKAKFLRVIGQGEVASTYSTAERVSLYETHDEPSPGRSAPEADIDEQGGTETSQNTLSYFGQPAQGGTETPQTTLSYFAQLAQG